MNWVGGPIQLLFIGLLLAASLKKTQAKGKEEERGKKRKIQAAKRRLQIQKAEHFGPPININNRNSY